MSRLENGDSPIHIAEWIESANNGDTEAAKQLLTEYTACVKQNNRPWDDLTSYVSDCFENYLTTNSDIKKSLNLKKAAGRPSSIAETQKGLNAAVELEILIEQEGLSRNQAAERLDGSKGISEDSYRKYHSQYFGQNASLDNKVIAQLALEYSQGNN